MVSPGVPSAGVSTVEERLSNLQQQHEMENLQAEVRDLQEKLETLKGMTIRDPSFSSKASKQHSVISYKYALINFPKS